MGAPGTPDHPAPAPVTLFLAGDVMTGRGVDQVLGHPGDPTLHEGWTRSAEAYVALAEGVNGRIPRAAGDAYVWGDGLDELGRMQPDARIVNLETAVTRTDGWVDKGINYRMHPANVGCLTAARIDCCVLANNHVLDYGHAGLLETLATLHAAGIATAGAGRTLAEARAPAVVPLPDGRRVLVFGCGTESSGIPGDWAAAEDRPGVHLLARLTDEAAESIGRGVRALRRPGDVVVASLHWGDNWGWGVPAEHVRFAHALVRAGVDCVHGHSSHHVRALEVFEGRLVLYGCGDLLNDYEGIGGREEFRAELGLMYFPLLEADTGRLRALHLSPTRLRRFRLERAAPADVRWLRETLDRESARFGVRLLDATGDGGAALSWAPFRSPSSRPGSPAC